MAQSCRKVAVGVEFRPGFCPDWPTFRQSWTRLCIVRPKLAMLPKFWQHLDNSTNLGRTWSGVGQSRSSKHGPTRPMLAKVGEYRPASGSHRPILVEPGPNLASRSNLSTQLWGGNSVRQVFGNCVGGHCEARRDRRRHLSGVVASNFSAAFACLCSCCHALPLQGRRHRK